MRHTAARQIIPEILRSPFIDRRALALTQAALLADHPGVGDRPGEHIIRRASELAPDPRPAVGPEPGVLCQDTPDFVAWAIELISHRPQALSVQLTAAWCVAELWPHASREERHHLQMAWYRSHRGSEAPDGSWVDRQTLEAWQRNLPTLHETEAVSSAALSRIFDEPSPEGTYQHLCTYLGPNLQLPRMFWMLGAVASRALLHRFDHTSICQHACLATIAGERLSALARPELFVVLLAQLTHEIWWHHYHDSRQLDPGSRDPDLSLEAAIEAGDYRAAQRLAREQVDDPETLWVLAFRYLRRFSDEGTAHWPRLLNAITIASHRSNNQALGPDDMAVLGAALAGVSWLSRSRQPA